MKFDFLKKWYLEAMKRTEGRGAFLEYMFHPPFLHYDIIADNHGHTNTFSDGERSVPFYIKTAIQNYVKKGAITDHDAMGYDETVLGFVNGVEITSLLEDNEVETLVLGYDQKIAQALVDSGEFPYLNKNFKFIRNLELTKQRINLCNKQKLTEKPITLSDVLNIEVTNDNGEKQSLSLSEIGINANHIIRPGEPLPQKVPYKDKYYQIQYGYLIRKLFNCIHADKKGLEFLNSKTKLDSSFNPHSPDDFMKQIIANKYGELYVESEGFWPTVEECINFAKKTGGVAILAHPFGYNKKINITTYDLIKKANKLGIDGIEVFHGFNQSDEVEFLYKYCYENGLLISMGSDTHGFVSSQGGVMTPGIAPGVGHQIRYFKNNIDCEYTSLYNLHYYGTGAWRGKKEFDYLSVSPTIEEVLENQAKAIGKAKAHSKKKKNQTEPIEREA